MSPNTTPNAASVRKDNLGLDAAECVDDMLEVSKK
jgi:hypothetical protein